jgi:hypothetical protein
VTFRTADEREQRRGLILGLTLAEILLLLLFLILLALSSKIRQLRNEAEQEKLKLSNLNSSLAQLQPLQAALLSAGASDISSVESLALRFQLLTQVEQDNVRLKQDNASLAQVSELSKSLGMESPEKLRSAALVMSRASKIDPSDPPALLKRAIDVLEKLGKETKPEDVRSLSEMKSSVDANANISSLQAQRDKLQADVNNLMHIGNGLTYPSCWTKKPGDQTEYIFDITFYDSGIMVRDAAPTRSKDPAWAMVGGFPRGKIISVQSFISATSRLAEWSKRPEQKCRFYTIDRDATGNDKQRYIRLRQAIESNFYINLRPALSTVPSVSTPTSSVSEQN